MSRAGNLLGAAREMRVALDLMDRGFEVFRPMSTATCDLVALKSGVCLRLEVKGLRRGKWQKGPVVSENQQQHLDCRLFEVLAQVDDSTCRIHYTRSGHCVPTELVLELTKDNEEYDKNVSNKVRERALSMTEKNA